MGVGICTDVLHQANTALSCLGTRLGSTLCVCFLLPLLLKCLPRKESVSFLSEACPCWGRCCHIINVQPFLNVLMPQLLKCLQGTVRLPVHAHAGDVTNLV